MVMIALVRASLCAGIFFTLITKSTIASHFVPAAQTASTVGNSALWHNPAGLAFMDGWESSANYLYEWHNLGNRHHIGAQLALNLGRAFSFGFGAHTRLALID